MWSSFLTIRLPRVVIFIWRHLHGRTCALLNSVHKFIETQGWLLLRFLICSHNQLSSFNPIIVQMTMVHFQCQHLLNKLIHLPSLWFMVLGKLPPEENCPPTLILTLTLNQTLTLTGGQFSSGAIFRTPWSMVR